MCVVELHTTITSIYDAIICIEMHLCHIGLGMTYVDKFARKIVEGRIIKNKTYIPWKSFLSILENTHEKTLEIITSFYWID